MRRSGLLAAVAALAFAGGAQAHTYGGQSAKDGRIDFRIGADSSTVVSLDAVRALSCRKGRIRSFRTGAFRQSRPFVRRTKGRFKGSIHTRGPSGSLVRRGRFSIRFRVRAGFLAVGVFRERLRLRDGTRCTSGRVRFHVPLLSTND
jgi:hypothetical protein